MFLFISRSITVMVVVLYERRFKRTFEFTDGPKGPRLRM